MHFKYSSDRSLINQLFCAIVTALLLVACPSDRERGRGNSDSNTAVAGWGAQDGKEDSFESDLNDDWSEEQGFIGAEILICLYLFLILWRLKIASDAKDRFGAVVAVGVSSLIFAHTAINLGMVCGILPVVGITLPLVSYGGSSVLTTMIGIGLLMNVSMRRYHF